MPTADRPTRADLHAGDLQFSQISGVRRAANTDMQGHETGGFTGPALQDFIGNSSQSPHYSTTQQYLSTKCIKLHTLQCFVLEQQLRYIHADSGHSISLTSFNASKFSNQIFHARKEELYESHPNIEVCCISVGA
jgi:hypothetical protein